MMEKRGINDRIDLLRELVLERIKPLARPPISSFEVGAAVVGSSGTVYFGVNLEFPGSGLEFSCHGEEFAVTLAKNYGEKEITELVVNAAPCGCESFLCTKIPPLKFSSSFNNQIADR